MTSKSYGIWRLLHASGELALERQYITRLLAAFPASALVAGARDRMVSSLADSGDFRGTIALLRPVASSAGARGRSAMARLGASYARIGDAQSARSLFTQLINGSRDDYALQGAMGLDALDRASKEKPNEFEAVRRARIYLSNRHWAEARVHFIDITDRFPSSPNRAEALYQRLCLFSWEKYDDAISLFEGAYTVPRETRRRSRIIWVATALQKASGTRRGRLTASSSHHPNENSCRGAYRNVADSFATRAKTRAIGGQGISNVRRSALARLGCTTKQDRVTRKNHKRKCSSVRVSACRTPSR